MGRRAKRLLTNGGPRSKHRSSTSCHHVLSSLCLAHLASNSSQCLLSGNGDDWFRWAQGFTQSKWFSMVGLDKRLNPMRKRLSSKPTSATKLDDVDKWTRSTRWRPFSLYNGVRIYELYHTTKRRKSVWPCRKVQVGVGLKADDMNSHTPS